MAKQAKTRADRVCSICQIEYKYCDCAEYQHLERWHDAYCSLNCHDLYNITAGWVNNWLDKEVELARLEKSDLSRFEYFPEWMQDVIKEMQGYKREVSAEAINAVLGDEESATQKNDNENKESESDVRHDPVTKTEPIAHPKMRPMGEVKFDNKPYVKNNKNNNRKQ